MIIKDMFDEFIFESIKTQTERLDCTFFHLDGVGELLHLDKLLTLYKLFAV
jgi:hypothetical protein